MIHFNTLELSTIKLNSIERNVGISRQITSVYGLPFYCLSGTNSNFDGTWFPFYGVSPYRNFSKKMTADDTLPEMFYKLFVPSSGYQAYQQNADLPARFGSLGCLLLSSCFGKGLWETPKGVQLLAYLKQTYPDFYDNWPSMLLNDHEEEIYENNLDYINVWLISKAHIDSPKDLAKLSPSTIEDLFALKTRSELYKEVDVHQRLCCLIL